MPIKPENQSLYPADWSAISQRIRERAGNRCEWCGVLNGSIGYREKDGTFIQLSDCIENADLSVETASLCDGRKIIRIVLTVAHLDHEPSNCDPSNLRAWCQRCHLRYDIEHHMRNAAETRARKRQEQAASAGQQVLIEPSMAQAGTERVQRIIADMRERSPRGLIEVPE